MNNIEILEKLIQRCKECKFATCEQCEINWCEVQAIKNLLEKNKAMQEFINNECGFIPKSKVKEKIEVIQKRIKEETRTDFLITLKILENELQELLEEIKE